jgi:hypothetical protein
LSTLVSLLVQFYVLVPFITLTYHIRYYLAFTCVLSCSACFDVARPCLSRACRVPLSRLSLSLTSLPLSLCFSLACPCPSFSHDPPSISYVALAPVVPVFVTLSPRLLLSIDTTLMNESLACHMLQTLTGCSPACQSMMNAGKRDTRERLLAGVRKNSSYQVSRFWEHILFGLQGLTSRVLYSIFGYDQQF